LVPRSIDNWAGAALTMRAGGAGSYYASSSLLAQPLSSAPASARTSNRARKDIPNRIPYPACRIGNALQGAVRRICWILSFKI